MRIALSASAIDAAKLCSMNVSKFKFKGLEDEKLKTIAIINLKGGTAKTCSTINLAAIFAKDYKMRVLVVDADSQGNTTEFFNGDPNFGSLPAVLRAAEQTEDIGKFALSNIQPTWFKNIWLLAADDSLMDLDLTKISLGTMQVHSLQAMVSLAAERNIYDLCIIDCPPAFNASSAAALMAANSALIPIKLDAFSLRGMANMMRQITNMKHINPGLNLLGLLPTMWYKSQRINDAEAQLIASGLPVLPHIRRSEPVDEMTFSQLPLVKSSPRSGACRDYRAAAKKIKEVLNNG